MFNKEAGSLGGKRSIAWRGKQSPPLVVAEHFERLAIELSNARGLAHTFPGGMSSVGKNAPTRRSRPRLDGRRLGVLAVDAGAADALAQALREKGAEVVVLGRTREALQRAWALDPEVILVDPRELAGTAWPAVEAVFADRQLRWACVLLCDADTLSASGVGTQDINGLCLEVVRLCADDDDLGQRAAAGEAFELSLQRVGPYRALRALCASGKRWRARFTSRGFAMEVDVAEGIIAGATGGQERVHDEALLGVPGLVKLLSQTTGLVRIKPVDQPSATNVMSPLDATFASARRLFSVPPSPEAGAAPVSSDAAHPLPTASAAPAARAKMASRTLVGVPAVSVAATGPGPVQNSRASKEDSTLSIETQRSALSLAGKSQAAERAPLGERSEAGGEERSRELSAGEPAAPERSPAPRSASLQEAPDDATAIQRRSVLECMLAQEQQDPSERSEKPPSEDASASRAGPAAGAQPVPQLPAPPASFRLPEKLPPLRAGAAVPASMPAAASVDAKPLRVSRPPALPAASGLPSTDIPVEVALDEPDDATVAEDATVELAGSTPGPFASSPAHDSMAPRAAAPSSRAPAASVGSHHAEDTLESVLAAEHTPKPTGPLGLWTTRAILARSQLRKAWQRWFSPGGGSGPAGAGRWSRSRLAILGGGVSAALLALALAQGAPPTEAPLGAAEAGAAAALSARSAPPQATPTPAAKAALRPPDSARPGEPAAPDALDGASGGARASDEASRTTPRSRARRAGKLSTQAGALLRKGDLSTARSRYLAALDASADYPRALYGLARVEVASGDGEAAFEYAKRAVRARPRLAANHLVLGDALALKGDKKAARAAYVRARRRGSRAARKRLANLSK